MALLAVLGAAALLAAGPGVPDRAGPWHRLGAAVVSTQAPIAYLRTTVGSPRALAVVVTGPKSRRLRVFWSTYCELSADDTGRESRQGTLAGSGRVAVYPPVLADASRCYVWVTLWPPAGARVTAATYAY